MQFNCGNCTYKKELSSKLILTILLPSCDCFVSPTKIRLLKKMYVSIKNLKNEGIGLTDLNTNYKSN